MSTSTTHLSTIEPDLLVATCRADGSVLMRNPAWKAILGDSEELWTNLMPSDREIAHQNMTEAAGGSLVTHALFMVESKHRDIPVPILLHFIPVDAGKSENLRSVAISGEVLTEPTTWTESQTQRHRMETLGRMTMGMAHDFNNLLSGILGHTQLWRLETDLDEHALEHISTIEKAALGGANLVSKVQQYIRQEARSSFERLDLTALIIDCISFTKPYWYNEPRRQGIDIEVVHRLDSLPPIEGSPAGLRDVFVNLILNAVQAMPDGGIIRIEGTADESEMRIRITDTGTGMSAEVRKHVFEPLYTTKGERGTRMGLAVVAGTMREHLGDISLDSELGKGTTFTLQFPLNVSESEAPVDHAAVTGGGNGASRRVLVVDDEEMVRTVLSRLLKLRGHAVTAAASGREAIDLFQSGDFDIILTDQGMPEMSGRELAYQIRKHDVGVPILLLTGDTDINFNPVHINQVLTKPFKIDTIDSVIAALT